MTMTDIEAARCIINNICLELSLNDLRILDALLDELDAARKAGDEAKALPYAKGLEMDTETRNESVSCWCFEYDVYLGSEVKVLNFGSRCGTVEEVYKEADVLGSVSKVVKKIIVSGVLYKEIDFPRDYAQSD